MQGDIGNLTNPAHGDYSPNGYWLPNAFNLTGGDTILKDHGNSSWGLPGRYARPWKIAAPGDDRKNEGLSGG